MNVIPRSAWGAQPPKPGLKPWRPGDPRGVVVHWVGGSGSLDKADPFVVIRGIQARRLASDYVDIDYNLLVDRSGRIIEGRGLGWQGAANGPATNSTHLSVCVLDNVEDIPTTAAKLAVFSVWQRIGGKLFAHLEVNTTTCPGDRWTAWVEHVRTGQQPPTPTPANSLLAAIRRVRDTIHQGPILRRGSRGQPVADWQFALVIGATKDLTIDGNFGPRTEAATRDFQRFFGLVVDGVVGPRTREAMSFTLKAKIR